MKHGESVRRFEEAFAEYVGARFAIGMTNGTVTLEVALRALGIGPTDRVATTALTMAATSISILNVGATPVYVDVDPDTWLMRNWPMEGAPLYGMPVSLYGLHQPYSGPFCVDDAAQTIRPHGGAAFTSYSLQQSKILSCGEGGVLVTNDENLARLARSISSLGYDMDPRQPRISSAVLKSPTYDRHVLYPCQNSRMNDVTASLGLSRLARMAYPYNALDTRREAAAMYREAIAGCAWIVPQTVPQGYTHDYWAFAVACDTPERAVWLQQRMGELGAEIPYGAWKLTYREPAFQHLVSETYMRDYDALTGEYGPMSSRGPCPVAEQLQPRLLQFQTNNLASAEQNARALRRVIQEAA